ncbi:hypothetical protein PVAP13_9KG587701, partial [Panicum virgatum]
NKAPRILKEAAKRPHKSAQWELPLLPLLSPRIHLSIPEHHHVSTRKDLASYQLMSCHAWWSSAYSGAYVSRQWVAAAASSSDAHRVGSWAARGHGAACC